MSYVKTIQPSYEITRGRKKLTGYLAELHDSNILLHSQVYSTNSQAEQALDRIVFDLLTDLAEHGLVDDVPAALEAENVSSTHLPSWQTSEPECPYCARNITPCPVCDTELCKNCNAPHHTWQCPEIGNLLFAEPVVMVMNVEYAPAGWAA